MGHFFVVDRRDRQRSPPAPATEAGRSENGKGYSDGPNPTSLPQVLAHSLGPGQRSDSQYFHCEDPSWREIQSSQRCSQSPLTPLVFVNEPNKLNLPRSPWPDSSPRKKSMDLATELRWLARILRNCRLHRNLSLEKLEFVPTDEFWQK